MTSGGVYGTVFQDMRPGAGLKKTAISLKKSWGGYLGTIPPPTTADLEENKTATG